MLMRVSYLVETNTTYSNVGQAKQIVQPHPPFFDLEADATRTPGVQTVRLLLLSSTPKPKQKRARKVVDPTDPVARAAVAAKPAALPPGPTKKSPARAWSAPTSTATVNGAVLPPPATSSASVALPPAARPGVLVLSVDSDSDSESDN
ncbi:hypothetical protein PR001_g16485 [Phytophthora rubi]|uniref:Uncharacterized protein n=1 Tax=Phytophthora rubi TaxID=129364 RepID=A0A6A3KUT3_9STRA|nr:hypothetical protein PR001_g16485 [Phytophthora rubi]